MRLDHLLSKEKGRVRDCIAVSWSSINWKFPVAMRTGDTPVPIPNTTVKTGTAEGTVLETEWKSRWPQDPKKETPDFEN